MVRLPRVSGRKAVKVFATFGWEVARQSGSHIILVREGEAVTLSVPNHKEIAIGTLRSLIRSAGTKADEFANAARKGRP